MKKLLYVTLFVIVAIASFVFVYFNQQAVTLNLGITQFSINLALVLVATFILGLLAGYVFTLPAKIRLRAKLSKARKQIRELDSPMG